MNIHIVFNQLIKYSFILVHGIVYNHKGSKSRRFRKVKVRLYNNKNHRKPNIFARYHYNNCHSSSFITSIKCAMIVIYLFTELVVS